MIKRLLIAAGLTLTALAVIGKAAEKREKASAENSRMAESKEQSAGEPAVCGA